MRDFVHSGFCPIWDYVQFRILSGNDLVFRDFCAESNLRHSCLNNGIIELN